MNFSHRFSDSRREAGDTLIEVLIASALMGLVVAAIIGGLATTVLGSKVHRQQATTNSVLVSVMERLKSDAVPRVRCAKDTAYYAGGAADRNAVTYQDDAIAAVPAGWGGTVSYTIQYQTVDAGAVEFQGTCEDDGTSGLTLQLITLTATTTDGDVSPSMSFVKGDY